MNPVIVIVVGCAALLWATKRVMEIAAEELAESERREEQDGWY